MEYTESLEIVRRSKVERTDPIDGLWVKVNEVWFELQYRCNYYWVRGTPKSDEVILDILDRLIGEEVLYMHKYKTYIGKLKRIKGRKVYLLDNGKVRRLTIKRVTVYHPMVDAFLNFYFDDFNKVIHERNSNTSR